MTSCGEKVLIKTFLVGILLGIIAAAGALYAVPAVDQYREVSIVSVAPNGGNRESFYINVPMDRVMIGAPGRTSALPAGLVWPDDEILANFSAEIFKVRNSRNAVIGVAARTAAKEESSDLIDWVIHLPSRGSLFFKMDPVPQQGGHRNGRLRAGSQEFDELTGQLTERWVSDTSGEEDAPVGRIELSATYIGKPEPLSDGGAEPLE